MKRNITMTADTTAAHGGEYLTATEQRLTKFDGHSGAVVLDTRGHLELVWWTNGDPSYLAEDGSDGIPSDVLTTWESDIRGLARHADDLEALHTLADYVAGVVSTMQAANKAEG